MTKKTNALIVGILGGIGTIASAIVTFCSPSNAVIVITAIGITETAAIEVINLFTKE